LGALSPADVPLDRVVAALRQRNLISLQLAGMIHELDQSARRLSQGEVRPADADHARNVVDVLRAEINAAVDKPVLEATHTAIESGMLICRLDRFLRRWPKALPHRGDRGRNTCLVFILVAVFWPSDLEKGIAAFEAQDWREAERHLTKDAENGDATAQLYLARVYRTTRQYQRAATVLRKAVTTHGDDDDLQRELGKLFLDLNQPANAVRYFQKARELEDDDQANWLWLVRGMRAAGDPNAEQVLQEAPPDVRAALSHGN
jgi:tetratricopeptide (TPR) repeat protein